MNELQAAIKRATIGRTFPSYQQRKEESAVALEADPQPPPIIYPKIIDIKRAVADYFSVEMVDLDSAHRNHRIAYVRHIVMYLCRRMTLHSLAEIGRRLGGRDHTTILHAYDKMCARITRGDKNLKKEIEELKAIIGGKVNGQEKQT